MDRKIPLYKQISEVLQPLGDLEALVLTTFGLNMPYFEDMILPAFFPNLGAVEAVDSNRVLFDYLEENPIPISVFYDANQLEGSELAELCQNNLIKKFRWQAHAVSRRSGCFHPKVIVAQLRETNHVSIVIGCSSANLTKSGWADNFEAGSIEVIKLQRNLRSSLLVDVKGLLDKLQKDAMGSVAIQRISRTIQEAEVKPFSRRKEGELYKSRLWFGQCESGSDSYGLYQWLKKNMLKDKFDSSWKLEILSPYFSEEIPELINFASKELLSTKSSDSILCYCPHKGEQYDVNPSIIDKYSQIENFGWAEFRVDPLKSQLKDHQGNNLRRTLHAKVYRFWSPEYEFLIVGSANATTAGNRDDSNCNNDEACLIFSREAKIGQEFGPWLKPIGRTIEVSECREEPIVPEDKPPVLDSLAPQLKVTFNWLNNELRLTSIDSRELNVFLGGQQIAISFVKSETETIITLKGRDVESIIRSPSVRVTSSSNDEIEWVCLIDELNLENKPPFPFLEPSLDELLSSWQMGPKDRLVASSLIASLSKDSVLNSSADSDFEEEFVEQDRLNDIFLLMRNFKSEILNKLEDIENNSKFSVMQLKSRLFGQSKMSVNYLVNTVINSSKVDGEAEKAVAFDAVDTYLFLLSLLDLLKSIQNPIVKIGFERETPELLATIECVRKDAYKKIMKELAKETDEPAELLDWVEKNYINMNSNGSIK